MPTESLLQRQFKHSKNLTIKTSNKKSSTHLNIFREGGIKPKHKLKAPWMNKPESRITIYPKSP